jgi:hypothetical protein
MNKFSSRTVSCLVFEMSDGLQRADNALLSLAKYKAFAHQKHRRLFSDLEVNAADASRRCSPRGAAHLSSTPSLV